MVSVEGELSRRTTELESLQARQRALAGQVNYATITLQLKADRAAAPAPPADRGGFAGGLRDGWHAFTAALGWVLTAVGALLPFLLLADWPVVEAEVRRVLVDGRAAPGHVFNLGHGVLPETDPTVLTRAVELVHSVPR